jgi:hypothetical protein
MIFENCNSDKKQETKSNRQMWGFFFEDSDPDLRKFRLAVPMPGLAGCSGRRLLCASAAGSAGDANQGNSLNLLGGGKLGESDPHPSGGLQGME